MPASMSEETPRPVTPLKSEMGQQRTLATYPCYVRSWVTSGRGEEVVGTSVLSQEETFAEVKILLSEGPESTVSSTGRRNTSFKLLCRCFEV